MPGIRTQPTSRSLGQVGGGGGGRAPCRQTGTRACLSREVRAGQKTRASLRSSLYRASCPHLWKHCLWGPSHSRLWGGKARRRCAQTQNTVLGTRVSEFTVCVCSAEETVSLSRCSSWKPQGRPSVGLRLWHPRGCGHGRSRPQRKVFP